MQKNLVLEDGTIFEGFSFGDGCDISGEVVFSTGMVGYHEALTDPSYQGQILVLTYPLIGNYGVPDYSKTNEVLDLFESKGIKARGLIVSSYINEYSHWQAVQSLDSWMKKEGVPGIFGIDTRSLTIKLREKGVMMGALQSRISDKKPLFSNPNKENFVAQVSIKKPRVLGKGKKKILLIDCGVKEGILQELVSRDVSLLQVPWDYNLVGVSFDGVVISNGPGDPKVVSKIIHTVLKLMNKKIPILGICLGNQILALAGGANTYKMKFGHRSHNQPVNLKGTKRCFLTTQNHGFVVDQKKLSPEWDIWFSNLNDRTNEGIKHKKLPFMAVQFHPEGRPGPYDTSWVFDEFLKKL